MISVCMATYNGEKYINEQLTSILKQLGVNDEIVISDDGSNDGTLDLIKSIEDERIRLVINPNDKGYSRNFAHAIGKAKGDILFISDQDDVWADGKVDLMIARLKKCHLVVSDAMVVDSDLKMLKESHFSTMGVKKGFLINFLKTRYIGACMAFRREVLVKALPFPKHSKFCAYDYWLALICELYYKVELEESALIYYRRHDNNALTGGEYSTNSFTKKLLTRVYTLFQLVLRYRK